MLLAKQPAILFFFFRFPIEVLYHIRPPRSKLTIKFCLTSLVDQGGLSCKILANEGCLARSCKVEFDFHDLARVRLSCKILQECVYLARSCKSEVFLQDNQLGKYHKT